MALIYNPSQQLKLICKLVGRDAAFNSDAGVCFTHTRVITGATQRTGLRGKLNSYGRNNYRQLERIPINRSYADSCVTYPGLGPTSITLIVGGFMKRFRSAGQCRMSASRPLQTRGPRGGCITLGVQTGMTTSMLDAA